MYNKVKIFFLLINACLLNAQIGTWEVVDSTGNAIDYQISCFDSSNCIATMWTPHPTISYLRCFVLKYSSDGGKSWKRYHYDCARDLFDSATFRYYWHQPEAIREIRYSSPSKVFAILDTNKFMQSYDFGKHWKRTVVDSNLYKNWNKTNIIFSINSDAFGVIASVSPYDSINPQYGRLFVTLDSFQTWKRIDLSTFTDIQIIKRIEMPSPNTLFLLSYSPQYNRHSFWLSRDTGASWSAQFSTYNLLDDYSPDLYCHDTANCWFAGIMKIGNDYKNVVYYTKDLGRNWDLQLSNTTTLTTGLFQIRFIDEKNGFTFSKRYGYKTRNGGKSWVIVSDTSGTQFPRVFTDYAIVSSSCFLAVTQWDIIYKCSLIETTVEETHELKNICITPNPANGYINIQLNNIWNPTNDLIKICNEIRIYNCIGECLLEKKISPNSHELHIDISNLPSGIFFIRFGNKAQMFIKSD